MSKVLSSVSRFLYFWELFLLGAPPLNPARRQLSTAPGGPSYAPNVGKLNIFPQTACCKGLLKVNTSPLALPESNFPNQRYQTIESGLK